MFDHGFPSDWSTLKKLIWLKGVIAGGASAVWKTVTGALIHITDALASPVKELSVAIEPQQSGSGDPSPDNVRPITGWTGATIYNDPMYGGLITWNQMVKNGDMSSGKSNWSASTYGKLKVVDGKLVLYTENESNRSWYITQDETVIAGHKYFYNANIQRLCGTPLAGSAATEYQFRLGGEVVKGITLSNANDTYHIAEVYTAQSNRASINFNKGSFKPAVGDIFSIWNVFLLDLTVMFGEGNEPTTAEEVKALFPDDYYAYNAGTVTTVSAVNGEPYTHIPISWQTEAGTVYGGTLDVVSGVLTVDSATKVMNGATGQDTGTKFYGKASAAKCHQYYARFNDGATYSADKIVRGNVCSHAMDMPADAGESLNVTVPDDEVWFIYFYSKASAYHDQPRLAFPLSSEIDTLTKANQFLADQYANGTPVTYTYLLRTPLTYQLTPQQVETLAGENNIWADVNGEITLTYQAVPETAFSDNADTGMADYMTLTE